MTSLAAMSSGTGSHKCSIIVPSFKILLFKWFVFHLNNTCIYFKPYSRTFYFILFLTIIFTYYKQEHKCIYDIFDCNWKDPQTVPECLSSQLRTFKFKSYNGFDGEVQFAKYIMQNSKVLQNVTIQTKAIDLKHQMLETFSLHPRGSTACNLHFETTRPTLYDFESSLWFFQLCLWSKVQLGPLIIFWSF